MYPKKLYVLLSERQKRRGITVTASAVCSAVLDLLGIAALIPVLMLVLDTGAVTGDGFLARFYRAAGFSGIPAFATAVCAAVLAVVVLKNLLGLYLADFRNRYLLSLYADLSARMYESCLSRGLLFIRKHNTVKLTNNVNAVCYRLALGVVGPQLTILSETVLLATMGIALLLYNPQIVLFAAAVFIPTSAVYTWYIRRRMEENGKQENSLQVRQNKMMYESLRGYADIEMNGARGYVAKRFREGLSALGRYRRKAALMQNAAGRIVETGLVLGLVLIVIAGLWTGHDLASLKITLGVFAIASFRIIPAVNRIVGSRIEIKRNMFTVNTVAEAVLDNPAGAPAEDTARMPFTQEIRVENLSFSYDGENKVIDNLSFTVRKGEHVGFRGPSGKGKSTLFNLLLGFFTPQQGEICIDGAPLTEANSRAWRNQAAYVSQEVFMADLSLAENIAFGIPKEEIDPKRLAEAVETASLTELAASLPDGLDTIPGEAGCRLSGGQRQRIGIARALYKQATVLLLDEATSSLDERTEWEINTAIAHLSDRHRELTLLVISHREHALSFCDRIIDL